MQSRVLEMKNRQQAVSKRALAGGTEWAVIDVISGRAIMYSVQVVRYELWESSPAWNTQVCWDKPRRAQNGWGAKKKKKKEKLSFHIQLLGE